MATQFSPPPAGHKPDYWTFWVSCSCGWEFPTAWSGRQRRAFARHLTAVEQARGAAVTK